MMMNLFSMFDPSTMKANIAWMMTLIPLIFMFSNFKFLHKYKVNKMTKMLMVILSKELEALLNPFKKKLSTNILTSIFFYCFFMNLMALTPFSFTPTAHLSISFTMALTMWLSFMMFGWTKNFSSMMAHMVPSGTPSELMNFMVVIELVSNLIRPITLSVRLSANMVAGHLLMSLLGNFCLSSQMTMTSFPLMMILSILELGVSVIQAYVLMTLMTLYSTEIHS